jgi:hypothetical protein
VKFALHQELVVASGRTGGAIESPAVWAVGPHWAFVRKKLKLNTKSPCQVTRPGGCVSTSQSSLGGGGQDFGAFQSRTAGQARASRREIPSGKSFAHPGGIKSLQPSGVGYRLGSHTQIFFRGAELLKSLAAIKEIKATSHARRIKGLRHLSDGAGALGAIIFPHVQAPPGGGQKSADRRRVPRGRRACFSAKFGNLFLLPPGQQRATTKPVAEPVSQLFKKIAAKFTPGGVGRTGLK